MSLKDETFGRATVVLRHDGPQGVHYDWLVDPPDGHALPEGRLWTLRVEAPPQQWPKQGTLAARELEPHRRVYLEYEGEISEGRGAVRRVAQGTCRAIVWEPEQRELAVHMDAWAGRVVLARVGEGRWRVALGEAGAKA